MCSPPKAAASSLTRSRVACVAAGAVCPDRAHAGAQDGGDGVSVARVRGGGAAAAGGRGGGALYLAEAESGFTGCPLMYSRGDTKSLLCWGGAIGARGRAQPVLRRAGGAARRARPRVLPHGGAPRRGALQGGVVQRCTTFANRDARGLARRGREWSLNDGQIPNPNVLGVPSCRGESAGVAKRPRERDLPPEIP
jgi:hypothetical protein